MKETSPTRVAIVVLGMHRSGTSALARTVSLLGAELPVRIMGASRGNETGHWEPERLVEIHEQLLHESGSGWNDWRSLGLAVLGAERLQAYREEITACIDAEYGDASLFVIKDPRISRFAPLYSEIFDAMGVAAGHVLCVRNPTAVISSLAARNAMAPGFGALLWLRYVVDSVVSTTSATRVVVFYEDLLRDWRSVATRLAENLGLVWPVGLDAAAAAIDGFLAPSLNHFEAVDFEPGLSPEIAGWIQTVYEALERLRHEPSSQAAISAIEQVRQEFDPMARLFGEATFPDLFARDRRIDDLQNAVADARGRAADAEAAISTILNSRSWRLTAPLRAASEFARRLRAPTT